MSEIAKRKTVITDRIGPRYVLRVKGADNSRSLALRPQYRANSSLVFPPYLFDFDPRKASAGVVSIDAVELSVRRCNNAAGDKAR